MSASILHHPFMERLQRDMQRAGLAETANVTDLHAERVRREREASERRHAERYGFGFTPDGDAA